MKRIPGILVLLAVLAACATSPAAPVANQQPAATPPTEPPWSAPMASQQPDATPTLAPPSAPAAQLVRADVPRITTSNVAQIQIDALVRGQNDVAWDLYRAATNNNGDNLIFSPYSIAQAFSLVYAGARGGTEAQMQDVLRYLPQETQHAAFNALAQRLARLGNEQTPQAGEPFALRIANGVWGQQGVPFQSAYLETLAQHYDAGLRTADFAVQPAAVADEINGWVAEQTEDRITNIVGPERITPDTRLVLANAIYFNAAWVFQFSPNATQDGMFTTASGDQATVPLMHGSVRAPYMEGDGYQAVQLPYANSSVDMLVILPAADRFADMEQQLDADFINDVRERSEAYDVTLAMPRWEFDSQLDLKELLTGMGMAQPFSGEADFSGIDNRGSLFISDAVHRGTITVDEQGTEAAAATVVGMPDSAHPAYPVAEMEINRPFIFAIVERDTGTLLFVGRVANPA